MKTKPALTFALFAALPLPGFAQSPVSQIEEAALASQAATSAPHLRAAHALAGQALDGSASLPVPIAAQPGRGLRPLLRARPDKAALRSSGVSGQTPAQKADSGWDAFWGGALWAGIGVVALSNPVAATVLGAIGATGVFIKLVTHDAPEPKDKLKLLAVAAVSSLALASPPLGALAFIGLGAAMAAYGLLKMAGAAAKQDD